MRCAKDACGWAVEAGGGTNRTGDVAPTALEVWGLGLLFVTLISACAAAGVALMPLLTPRLYRRLLTYFLGLGVGSLSGSAVFHLVPQAFDLVSGCSHSYLTKAWTVIGGIYLFYFADKLIQFLVNKKKRRSENNDGHSNELRSVVDSEFPSGGGREVSEVSGESSASSIALLPNGASRALNGDHLEVSSRPPRTPQFTLTVEEPTSTSEEAVKELEIVGKGREQIASVAWMIIFGDGLHNFIDGLSIGAAFTSNVLTGISVSVAVLCEEFPHELGDVAILLTAGMTLRQALIYNLLSAAVCYVGFVFGVTLGELADANVYIFALAGGMFLYISLASMVPEMNTAVEKQMMDSPAAAIRTLFLQAAGVLTGLIVMFLMAFYGSSIRFS